MAVKDIKYDPKFCDMIIDFFDIEPYYYPVLRVEKDEDGEEVEILSNKPVANKLPTLTKFAKSIGTTRQTLLNWSKALNDDEEPRYPEWVVAYAHAKTLQKDILIENGLNGLYNSQAFIFTAKNITDMVDKQTQSLEDKDGNSILTHVIVVPGFSRIESKNGSTKE